ncbi:ABC transporter ATP-binding protein [Rhizobacter sp. Root1221]|uniref:ABC transporter ATP-binding protein n=1 Tax=Rhizobacter sp. Root1221 TaxID=1736433 RepID=UPI0006FF07AF|nr:ABC transporter ATP-binding protein [Rhizobacter sp. Root1221]KQW02652.1 multidrug ABC transporter ATP-binding protein [Rhizobacter sp. Root1221]
MTDVPRSAEPTSLSGLYRHVWMHARGARLQFGVALSMLGGSQLLKLATPWLAAQAINSIQTGGRAALPAAGLWIAAIVALQVVTWVLHGPARVMERAVALRVRRNVADGLYVQLANAPLTWHEAHHSGDLQHRVHQASTALGTFAQSQFIYLQNFINIAGPLTALMLLSQLTGLMAIVGFIVTAVVIVRFDRALMVLAARENQADRRYAARLLDFVGNISAVASLRLQAATRRLLDARLLAVFEPLRRTIVLNEWKWCSVDLLTLLLTWSLVVVYAVSTTPSVATGGTVLIGSLFMIYQYAQQAAGVLGSMASNYQGLARTQTDFASGDVIRQAPAPIERGPAMDPAWQRIELQGLGFTHAKSERGGVRGVHLALNRGERIALVGPSGSGKSTLLRVLAGLYDADRGHIAVDGVAQLGRRHLADVSTLIPQEAEVFEASMRENLTLDQDVPADALARAVHVSALDAVLVDLPRGLDTPMSERGFNLSGGQRQRLALARGVLAAEGSSLLLLDEPTSALDALTERTVHERLDAACPDACIVSAVHRMGLLPHFDRVVFMVDGAIADIGTADEVAARQPMFAAMLAGAAAGDRPEPTTPLAA